MPDPSTPPNDASLRTRWAHEVRTRLSSLGLSPTREADIVDELSQNSTGFSAGSASSASIVVLTSY
jgi:hypothetical protein